MIKMFNLCTQELNDPEKAVREILEPLGIKNNLLKNSVAMLFCHSKFIETGIAEAVYKSLPFDVLGCTSQYFGLPAMAGTPAVAGTPVIEGEIILTVTVLTSADVDFSVGISGRLNEDNVEECIHELYRRTVSSFEEPPSLVFAFPPTMTSVPGDVMTSALDRACAGIPIFGSVALDISNHIQHPRTIFKASTGSAVLNGAFNDRMALLLLRGSVKPRFFYSSFPEKSILPWDAVITKAAGHRIISINNRPALSFIRELGFFQNDTNGGILLYPLVVEYPNNETSVVVLQDIDAEGQLLCGMNVKSGGILNIGAITADAVLESARVMAQSLKKDESGKSFLMFSCFLRNVVLGGSSQAEFELVRQELGGYSGSWLFINSGGELCPGYTENGKTVNRFHEYALIACQF
jgi:hypothetical protein